MNKFEANQNARCARLAALHAPDQAAWVLANAWDRGSAAALEACGFEALATTSAGFAETLGKADGAVSLEEKLQHCEDIAGATSLPVSVDFEDGFGDDPEAVAANLKRLGETGVAGASIEDYSRAGGHIFEPSLALERVHAAVEATTALAPNFQLTARADGLIRRSGSFEEVLARLVGFAEAGAPVVYAPGLATLEQVQTVASSVNVAVNVLGPLVKDATVADLGAAGARRVSLGSALQAYLARRLKEATDEMTGPGGFSWFWR